MERDFTACMQCFDQASGKTGDFIYRNSDKVTISPVFPHFGQLLNWMKENGYKLEEHYASGYIPFNVVKI